jgi:hypothetical protein
MLSLMVSGGSFHKSNIPRGGSRPKAARATRLLPDVTPAATPPTTAASTHTAASVNLMFSEQHNYQTKIPPLNRKAKR